MEAARSSWIHSECIIHWTGTPHRRGNACTIAHQWNDMKTVMCVCRGGLQTQKCTMATILMVSLKLYRGWSMIWNMRICVQAEPITFSPLSFWLLRKHSHSFLLSVLHSFCCYY
jgi:hypothetical protein